MGQYIAPLRDMQFVLHELLNVEAHLKELPHYVDIDTDIINQVLEEGGKFTSQILFPINHGGDREGRQCARGLHGFTCTSWAGAFDTSA